VSVLLKTYIWKLLTSLHAKAPAKIDPIHSSPSALTACSPKYSCMSRWYGIPGLIVADAEESNNKLLIASETENPDANLLSIPKVKKRQSLPMETGEAAVSFNLEHFCWHGGRAAIRRERMLQSISIPPTASHWTTLS
jgi:hypothetical protein